MIVVPLHQGMFGQPSQSLVGMGSQSSALVEKWKKLHDLEKTQGNSGSQHQRRNQVFSIKKRLEIKIHWANCITSFRKYYYQMKYSTWYYHYGWVLIHNLQQIQHLRRDIILKETADEMENFIQKMEKIQSGNSRDIWTTPQNSSPLLPIAIYFPLTIITNFMFHLIIITNNPIINRMGSSNMDLLFLL